MIDFLKWGWHSQMVNQFENYPDVLLNGRPVLEFYDITESKWAALGYESLFFIFFFFAAWLVSTGFQHLLNYKQCMAPLERLDKTNFTVSQV